MEKDHKKRDTEVSGFDTPSAGPTKTAVSSNQHIDEINIHCSVKAKIIHLKYYLSNEERRTIIKDCGDAAVMLFEWYLRVASFADGTMDDARAAHYFGWDIQKVKRNRLKLTKTGWFDCANYKISKTRRGMSYYIGKQEVASFRNSL